jgi:V-type H+-transporting ATPase subunit a
MMGLFSMFTGLIYNDIFSKSMALFGSSRWIWSSKSTGSALTVHQSGVYPIGIDPGWHGAENALLFGNSYKMKLSIVLGVIHMIWSLCLSLCNSIYFKQPIEIYADFIPRLIFLLSIFGYLALIIIYKWSINWLAIGKQPPGLLNTLIYMFLSPGKILEPLYPGQKVVQILLLLLALACVPWLLFTKPLLLFRESRKNLAQGYENLVTISPEGMQCSRSSEGREEESFNAENILSLVRF